MKSPVQSSLGFVRPGLDLWTTVRGDCVTQPRFWIEFSQRPFFFISSSLTSQKWAITKQFSVKIVCLTGWRKITCWLTWCLITFFFSYRTLPQFYELLSPVRVSIYNCFCSRKNLMRFGIYLFRKSSIYGSLTLWGGFVLVYFYELDLSIHLTNFEIISDFFFIGFQRPLSLYLLSLFQSHVSYPNLFHPSRLFSTHIIKNRNFFETNTPS